MKGATPDPHSFCAELRRRVEGRSEHWERILAELDFADCLRQATPGQTEPWRALLHDVLAGLLEAAGNGGDGREAVAAAEAALAPIAEVARTFTVHCIGHAHLDMNWLWPWNDTVLTCRDMFTSVLGLMEEFPDLRFSQSQAALYQAMERFSPATAGRMRDAIHRGQWEVTASTWVEGDRNLPCGESLVRQVLLSRRYLRERWRIADGDLDIDWAPDTFGHSAAVPQVLRKSGLKRCYLCRGAGDRKAFAWQGLDGSRVLVWNDASLWYLGTVTPADLSVVVDAFGKTGLRDYPMVYGVGDHGGGPTRKDLLAIRRMASWPVFPRIRFSTSREFFDALEPHLASLPVVTGELNGVFRGCYSSQGRVKREHREAENRILTAESLCTLAGLLIGFPYPQAILRQAWLDLLFNQFHDILPGSGTPDTYRFTLALLQSARAAADVAAREATSAIARVTASDPDTERSIVVFNPLPCTRTQPVLADVFQTFDAADPLELLDADGRGLCHQVCAGSLHDIPYLRVAFTAADVPGLGYRRYRLARSRSASPGSAAGVRIETADTGLLVVRNERLRITVDPGSGALLGIRDLALGRELVPAGRRASLLAVTREGPHEMSSWETGPHAERVDLLEGALVEVEDAGPARVTVRSRQQWGHSTFTRYTTLAAGAASIELRLSVDWHEKGNEHVGVPGLQLSFPFDLGEPKATYEIPFGAIERPVDGLADPALKWVDVSGISQDGAVLGFTLANNGRHAFTVGSDELLMTVLRSSYEPDLEPDQGMHDVSLTLAFHPGWCDAAACARFGLGLNQPFVPIVGTALAASLPEAAGLLEIESDAVAPSAVKLSEDAGSLVLRLYETRGSRADAVLRFGFQVASVEEADLMERPAGVRVEVARSRCWLAFGPFEIKTLLVRLAERLVAVQREEAP